MKSHTLYFSEYNVRPCYFVQKVIERFRFWQYLSRNCLQPHKKTVHLKAERLFQVFCFDTKLETVSINRKEFIEIASLIIQKIPQKQALSFFWIFQKSFYDQSR